MESLQGYGHAMMISVEGRSIEGQLMSIDEGGVKDTLGVQQ